MDLYPDSDYLAGVEVEESVNHDNRADPDDMLHCYVQGGEHPEYLSTLRNFSTFPQENLTVGLDRCAR